MLLEPGSVFLSRYRIVAPPTPSEAGEIYAVDDLTSRQPRSLELYHPAVLFDARRRDAFLRAAGWAMRFESPRVVRVHAAGLEPSTLIGYTVLDLASGRDLHDRISESGPLGTARATELVAQLLEGVEALHAAGFAHGDLDPRSLNVDVLPDGALDVRIHDLVHRRLVSETRGDDPEMAGGPVDYLAPELARAGAVRTPSSDLWAIGLIAFFTFCGLPYWVARSRHERGAAIAVLREILMGPLAPASVRAAELGSHQVFPAGFDDWFTRCVNRAVDARFGSVGEAAAAWATVGASRW